MKTIITSKIFRVNWYDIAHGLMEAVGGGAVGALEDAVSTHTVDWGIVLNVSIASGSAFLIKRFLTPAQIITPLKTPNNDETK